jgi:hypothetical protein
MRPCRLHAPERRPEIGLENAREGRIVEVGEQQARRRGPGRIVDENVEAAEGLDRARDRRLAARPRRDVALDRQAFRALGFEPLRRLGEQRSVDLEQPERRPLPSEGERDPAADAAPRAGDECDLPLQSRHADPPPSRLAPRPGLSSRILIPDSSPGSRPLPLVPTRFPGRRIG